MSVISDVINHLEDEINLKGFDWYDLSIETQIEKFREDVKAEIKKLEDMGLAVLGFTRLTVKPCENEDCFVINMDFVCEKK